MNQATKPVEQVVAGIEALNLDPIKLKLMDREEGQGWSREHADRMEIGYKRFLTLLVKYPEETIAPSKDIDKFWHGHILDTMKYAEDCERVFGYFLHHFPYFGMRGEQDAADLRTASERMHAIYESEFGEPMPGTAAFCMAASPASGNSAFCMAAKPVSSAFCMATRPATADSAFCMAAKPVSSAFCMAAQPQSADAAFCMAAVPATKKQSAFCMAAKPLRQ